MLKFEFSGNSLEAVLDRLPIAKVIDKYDNKYLIESEVFGKGIIMWIMSQMQFLKVIEPKELREEIKKIVLEIKNNYDI